MKIIAILLILFSAPAMAITWSYQIIENKKESPEYKLDSSALNFNLSGIPCSITPTEIKTPDQHSFEIRHVLCHIGKYAVYTSNTCGKGHSSDAVLHIQGKNHAVITLSCRPE